MDEAGMCVLINLNQEDHQIVPQILERSNSLEEGTLKPVNGGYLIPLDTKYYTTQMQLQVFNNLQTASQWATDTKKPVFALFIHCHIAQTSAKLLSQVRDVCRQIKTTTKALLIGGNCSAFHSQVSLLQHFCTNEGIEQIELAPNRETMDLLKEYHERWGIDRMWEILESVDWPWAHESDDDELKDPDLPDSDDEAAILEVFDKYNFGFARMLGNNYLGTLNIANLCDESNFNTERDAKESSPTIAANNITHQCSQDDDAKKAKKKKGKKSKNKSPQKMRQMKIRPQHYPLTSTMLTATS
uniref:Uncharacterized protein n=1 Tax=Ditylenchus dipsaci TaxID=166011 RepID=A0A915DGL2_9BILA